MDKSIIGRAEKVRFPTLGRSVVHARIDTGAKTSSVWVSEVKEHDDVLYVRFMGKDHEFAHKMVKFVHYTKVNVSSSMGHQQLRYKVKLSVIIKKRRVITTFTLADRSSQVYPVLIGRNTLLNKFIVDVSKGSPLREAERLKSATLQAVLRETL